MKDVFESENICNSTERLNTTLDAKFEEFFNGTHNL